MKICKILVINFGGIGDEILFFPTLKSIKEAYPQSEITLVTEPRSKSAKELTNLVNDIITCDIKNGNKYQNIMKFLFEVWSKKFDMVISSGGSSIVSLLLFLTGIKNKYGYDSGLLSRLVLTKAIPLNKKQYAGDMYNDLASGINPNRINTIPEVFVAEENLNIAKQIIDKSDKKTIIIHPGVSKLSIKKNIIKFWDAENWISLILEILKTNKYKVILVGGPDDNEIFDNIRQKIKDKNIDNQNLLDLYGKTKNISQLAALIKASDLLVCVDSAPMHIGVGVGTKVAAIFGPTDEHKLIPISDERFTAIKIENNDCRPCLWDVRQISCEKIECLNISVDNVMQVICQKLD